MEFSEEEDPASRYQNPRYSGKSVPDRGNDPKRKVSMGWHAESMSELNDRRKSPHTPLSKRVMKTWENETVTGRDNPKWNCESCGKKGAQDYAGQGRVCEPCASNLGF